MGKIAGKVPKLQEKMFDFPYFSQKFDRFFQSPFRKKTSKKKEQSATFPKESIVTAIVFWNKGAYA